MAIDFIVVNKTQSAATQAQALLNYINSVRSAMDQGAKLLAVMSHNNNGVNFAPLETLYGLTAGQGQIVFDLVNGADGSMRGLFQTANAKDITEKVGG